MSVLTCDTPEPDQERHFRGEWGEREEGESEAREGSRGGGEGEDEHQAELLRQGEPATHLILDDGREDCTEHWDDQDYNEEVWWTEMSK